MEWVFDIDIWASLLTLSLMEIVLGIDNIVFISVLVGRLPEEQQDRGRVIGLLGAMVMRVLLLFGIVWLTQLTASVFNIFDNSFSWRDIILIAGGAFLLAKATMEIHHTLEGGAAEHKTGAKAAFAGVIVQIMLLDIVFSLDSVLTAIGMAEHIEVMIAAVVLSMGVMLWASGPISAFIKRHPTTKMLALSFLLLIGMALVADGLGEHIPRGYLYSAIVVIGFPCWSKCLIWPLPAAAKKRRRPYSRRPLDVIFQRVSLRETPSRFRRV